MLGIIISTIINAIKAFVYSIIEVIKDLFSHDFVYGLPVYIPLFLLVCLLVWAKLSIKHGYKKQEKAKREEEEKYRNLRR